MELIKHAAIRTEDGRIFMGKHHADCFHQASNIKVETNQKAENQGFITSTGRYVQRAEAAEIALAANQVTKRKLLFSEDLWSPQHKGRFTYDTVKGYEPIISEEMRFRDYIANNLKIKTKTTAGRYGMPGNLEIILELDEGEIASTSVCLQELKDS